MGRSTVGMGVDRLGWDENDYLQSAQLHCWIFPLVNLSSTSEQLYIVSKQLQLVVKRFIGKQIRRLLPSPRQMPVVLLDWPPC